MTRNLPLYIAGAVAVAIAGTMAYRQIEKSVGPVDFNKVGWCDTDSTKKGMDGFYSDFSRQYMVQESPAGRKKFVEEVLLRNNGNIRKPRIMLPCDL